MTKAQWEQSAKKSQQFDSYLQSQTGMGAGAQAGMGN